MWWRATGWCYLLPCSAQDTDDDNDDEEEEEEDDKDDATAAAAEDGCSVKLVTCLHNSREHHMIAGAGDDGEEDDEEDEEEDMSDNDVGRDVAADKPHAVAGVSSEGVAAQPSSSGRHVVNAAQASHDTKASKNKRDHHQVHVGQGHDEAMACCTDEGCHRAELDDSDDEGSLADDDADDVVAALPGMVFPHDTVKALVQIMAAETAEQAVAVEDLPLPSKSDKLLLVFALWAEGMISTVVGGKTAAAAAEKKAGGKHKQRAVQAAPGRPSKKVKH